MIRVELGEKVKDSITGFEGIAVGRATYLYGCVRVLVEPEGLKEDGTTLEAVWFDEQRLIEGSEAKSGGPQSTPPSRDP